MSTQSADFYLIDPIENVLVESWARPLLWPRWIRRLFLMTIPLSGPLFLALVALAMMVVMLVAAARGLPAVVRAAWK